MANLNASEPKGVRRVRSKQRPAPATITITAVAEEIAEAVREFGKADAARILADQIAGPDRGPSSGATAREMSLLAMGAGKVEEVSHDRCSVLEQTMLRLEPRTPNEAFSLALMLVTELDTFICNFTDHQNNPEARAAGQIVDRAMRAVVDGLYHHVKLRSPLVGHYYTPDRRDCERRTRRQIEALAEMTDPEIKVLIARREREQGSAD
jgi:hypothetical protein